MTESRVSKVRTRVLANGTGFCEGPVITQSGDIIVTSLTDGCLYRIQDGEATVYAETNGGANGATEGLDGKIYVAQNGGRTAPTGPLWGPGSVGGIQVADRSGSVRWVTRDPIAPNDLCFGPDGLLYVTDPTRSLDIDDGRIWRIDTETGVSELLMSVPWYPNGIAFGPDGALYIASFRTASIERYQLQNGKLVGRESVIQMTEGHPDGMAFDERGYLVIGAISTEGTRGTIQTWTTENELVEVLEPGPNSAYTNLAFSEERVLVVTDSDAGAVLAIDDWPAAGLPLYPFR